jgi:hypothetical protein
MWRIVVRGHRSANSTTDSTAKDGAITSTDLIADRSASSTTDPATNGGIQG